MSEKVNRRKLLVGAGSAGLVASSGVAPAYAPLGLKTFLVSAQRQKVSPSVSRLCPKENLK